MKNLRNSKQRQIVLDAVRARCDHPSADQIYLDVRTTDAKISRGTVYRNLTLLSELGIIQKISCDDESEHFDGDPAPHNHFICRICGSIIDLEMDNIDFVNTLAAQNFPGKVEGHSIYFYGTCHECMTNEK